MADIQMFEDNIKRKLLFLGPNGSYTDFAKDKFIEKYKLNGVEEIAKTSLLSAIQEFDTNKDKGLLAVLPIENSIDGVVRETIDNLTRVEDKSVKILSELALPIAHCLITKAKDFSEIKTVISYPQGIAQCRGFINKNLPENVSIQTTTSTAKAVQDLKNADSSVCAIASEKSANLYGIPILAKNINDEKDNKTRFILIGREETLRTPNDKTSISFSTENKPGALNKILNILEKYNINMSYIDSRPSKRVLGTCYYY